MTFVPFDSLEAMQDFLRRQTDLANSLVQAQPWQHAIGRGQYNVRAEGGLVVFGYTLTEEELEASEREAGSFGEELEYTMSADRSAYGRGFMYGRYYSMAEPEGEWGTIHRVDLLPLSRELFEEAQAARWAVGTEFLLRCAKHVEQVSRG